MDTRQDSAHPSTPNIDMPPELARTGGGRKIHLASCAYAANIGVPWVWALGRTYAELEQTAKVLRLRVCKHCHPLTPPAG